MFSQAKSFGLNLLSCPSYHSGNSSSTSVTFRNKNCNICVFPIRFFMETLYSFGDLYGLILVIIGLSMFLGIFSVIAQTSRQYSKLFGCVNFLISYFIIYH